MTIRRLEQDDREPIRNILVATGVFTEGEISIALELIDIGLTHSGQREYEIFTAVENARKVLGYICFGPTPATDGTFDLYWIAVDPASQGTGVGAALIAFMEKHLAGKGRFVVAETSSTPRYDGTRSFYLHRGFAELARIREYYRPGDDLVIFGKYLSTT
jgi:ribosomal protein S18 acetylase RimI-like enzyme